MPKMRAAARLVAILGSLALAGCAAAPTWQKAGSDASAAASDASECRLAAQREALRLFPYGSRGPYYASAGAVGAAQMHDEADRSAAEAQHFNQCMRSKGYTLSAA